MARTPDLLTKKQSAVIGAVGLYATTPPEASSTDSLTKIMQIANKALQRIGEELTREEFDAIITNLQESDFVVFGPSKVPTLSALLIKVPELEFRGKNADLKRAQFLGQSVFLENDELDDYVIEFNYDGQGNKRLPSGETTSESLATLTQRLRVENGLTKGDSSGVQNWVVSLDHHPDAPTKKGIRKFRSYLRYLDEQDPTRRNRITAR